MSVVRNHTHPLVTPDDRVIVGFTNYEPKARVWVRALKAGTEVVIRSAPDQATAQAKGAADATTGSLVYDQVEILDIPATSAVDRVSEIRCISGQAAIEIVSPSECRSFLSQPSPTIT